MLEKSSQVDFGVDMLQCNCAAYTLLPDCTNTQQAMMPLTGVQERTAVPVRVYTIRIDLDSAKRQGTCYTQTHTHNHLPSWDAAATAADMSWCSGLARYKYGAGVKRPLTIGACCSMASRAAMRSSITCK